MQIEETYITLTVHSRILDSGLECTIDRNGWPGDDGIHGNLLTRQDGKWIIHELNYINGFEAIQSVIELAKQEREYLA